MTAHKPGGGSQAIRVLGPFTVAHDDTPDETGSGLNYYIAFELDPGTILMTAWAFFAEDYSNGVATIGIANSAAALSDNWDIALCDIAGFSGFAGSGVSTASVKAAYDAYGTPPRPAKADSGGVVVWTSTTSATTGQADIYALVHVT